MQLKVLDVRHASAGGGRVYVYGWDLVYGTDAASLIQTGQSNRTKAVAISTV